jgi:hypothetical protein
VKLALALVSVAPLTVLAIEHPALWLAFLSAALWLAWSRGSRVRFILRHW